MVLTRLCTTHRLRTSVALLACSFALLIGGCPVVTPTFPVLAGDWETTLDNGTDVVFTFNDDGVLTTLKGTTTQGVGVQITVNGAESNVTGNQVTVTIPLNNVTATYTGTLSADQNTITGTLSGQIQIQGNVTITIPGGELTLVRAGTGPDLAAIQQKFETSLHKTREGKAYFYAAAQGGFETLTGIPMTDLACQKCHAPTLADGTPVDAATYTPSCADCHADPENPTSQVAESICLGCHSRQGSERSLAANADFAFADVLSDVHRNAGMVCTDCHDADEMHGTGTAYDSLLAADAPRPQCEDCHVEGGQAPAPALTVAEHSTHLSNIECAACHVQSVISCYSCHFETEIQEDFKRFYGPPPRAGFVMLVNRTDSGKVSTATFQSVTYQGKAFTVIAPYYAHTISNDARNCPDCHGTAAATSYAQNGSIDVATFANGTLTGPSG